jgi:hypothetical protein
MFGTFVKFQRAYLRMSGKNGGYAGSTRNIVLTREARSVAMVRAAKQGGIDGAIERLPKGTNHRSRQTVRERGTLRTVS